MLKRTLEPEVMDTVEEAADYDSMDHSHVNQVFVQDLMAFARASDSSMELEQASVLDLGTGTALIPVELGRHVTVRTLIAVDLSVEMLKLASQHVNSQGRAGTVLPVLCDAKRLPIADASCDVVMSNSIVHHIPEPKTVFAEMRRVLRPGGMLFIRDLMRPKSAADVDFLVETYAGAENAHQQRMFRESLHAALTVAEVGELLSDHGFPSEWVQATSDRHWTVAGRS